MEKHEQVVATVSSFANIYMGQYMHLYQLHFNKHTCSTVTNQILQYDHDQQGGMYSV